MSETHYQAGQRALGIAMPLSGRPGRRMPPLTANLRKGASSQVETPAKIYPPLDRTLLDVLPHRPKAWMDMVGFIAPEQVQFWVGRRWSGHYVEFVDVGRMWAVLSRSGEIERYASQERVMRTLVLTAAEALEIHRKHPLTDVSLNDGTLRMQWRREGDDSGKDAGAELEAMARTLRGKRS